MKKPAVSTPPAQKTEPSPHYRRPADAPGAQEGVFDSTEAVRFLALLGIDPGQAWFRSFGPNGSNRRRRGADLHGFDADALQADISDGQTPYLVIGAATRASGPKGGVRDVDVTTLSALWVEWDDMPEEEQKTAWQVLGLPEPTAMVSTGGKSVHCYWRLEEPLPPNEWKPVQKRLIQHCKSDPACSNPARVMRLPGCPYIDKKTGKPTGRRCEVIASPGARYSLAEILAALPAEAPDPAPAPVTRALAPSPASRYQGKLPPRSVAEVEHAAQFIPRRVRGKGTYPSDRNALCGCAAALAEAGHPNPEEHALALLGNDWPSERDARQVLESATTRKAASFWAIAQEHGFDLKRPSCSNNRPGREGTGSAKPSHQERWRALEASADEIAGKEWPLLQSLSAIADAAKELDLAISPRGSEQLLEAADRRRRPTSEPIFPGQSFTVTAHPWGVDGIFRHALNLLVGQPGAGKSRLAASLAYAWLRGDLTWLGRTLPPLAHGEQRHCLIVGVDQGLEDWAATLAPVGLATRNGQTVTLHSRVTLWAMDTGMQLDAAGLRRIRSWVDDHPGGLVVVDSLAACLPAGVDQDRAGVRRPIQGLAEAIGTGWGLLLHHTRKGAGKDRNLGVGAGSGSAQIDAAVSRVVGLGLIHKMEGGVMLPQEADPRRELLSTKRGGASLHLVIASDGSGTWHSQGSAEALKQQERLERVRGDLTESQADALAALEAADGWLTVREVALEQGESYDPKSGKAATLRKTLARLEALGLIESARGGNERTYRVRPSYGGDAIGGSTCSPTAVQGISPAHPVAHQCSPCSPPAHHSPGGEPGEPEGEPAKTLMLQGVSRLSHLSPPPCSTNTTRRHSATPTQVEQVEQLLREVIASGCGFLGRGAESPHTRATGQDDWSWPAQA